MRRRIRSILLPWLAIAKHPSNESGVGFYNGNLFMPAGNSMFYGENSKCEGIQMASQPGFALVKRRRTRGIGTMGKDLLKHLPAGAEA